MFSLDDIKIDDLESVRLLLHGGSVVDWHQLQFHNQENIDTFLRLNEFEPSLEEDMTRLNNLREQAVEYLIRSFSFRFSQDVTSNAPARDLFLIASRRGPSQMWACVILKVMHILLHLEAREIVFRMKIPYDDVFRTTEQKIMHGVEMLQSQGHQISEFQWSRKTKDSLITKLLEKRNVIAATVYDSLRFRIIVPKQEDIFPLLILLTRHILPFNHIIPEKSTNTLVDFNKTIADNNILRSYETQLQQTQSLALKQEKFAMRTRNKFSGNTYKTVNFIANVPLRVDRLGIKIDSNISHIVLSPSEFQIVDQATAEQNEQDENSHNIYKAKQRKKVRRRLMRGSRKDRTKPETDHSLNKTT